ncbi:N-acetylmuramoyl-L-alanine amidase [Azospirillum sp.]|uniref:N-acetylmuramoyl-L-alanine amidase n=1 Tax=Azospirillum sp. TaxID=34012 RepID=UPI002D6DE6E3|nr:N-acetylmuramoyl-L-alanine amidase [Azospirillum sp.]HYD68442.1 N-acetylmuramoyl-L-alanine amidase [Azospirillum sp.]
MPRFLALVVAVAVLLGAAWSAGTPSPARAAAPNSQTTAALPLPLGPSAARPAVIDARLGVHPDKTRFVLEVSEAFAFRVTTEADPYRVSVDLPDLAWAKAGETQAGRGLVQRYRYGPTAGGGRLVFETGGPVRVREAYIIPPREGHRPRLVIDLEGVSRAEFDRGRRTVEGGEEPKVVPAVAAPPPAVLAPPPPPAPAPAVQPARAVVVPVPPPQPQARPAPARDKPMIVIDPGHGGEDPGAIGVSGGYEKEITLAVARELRQQLEATGRYRVRLTRDKDVFIRLRERVAIARDADADLFISLHADSIGTNNVRGLSIYTLSDKASDREAEMLAAKENRADAIAGLDLSAENDLVASILIDLAQRDTMNHSKRFAGMALEHVGKEITLLPSKPHRQAGFAVLTAPDVPSVLVEMGYLSSPQDASLLNSHQHRERLARSMTRGIDAYFKWLGGRRP